MIREDGEEPGPARLRPAGALLGVWGLYQIAAGLYFILLRPSFLSEDLRASGANLNTVRIAAPEIESWLQFVFAVLGGQMAAVGLLVISGAISVWRGRRPSGAERGTYFAGGLLSLVLMSAINFALGSDFRWLLVAPVLVWLAAMLLLERRAWAEG